MKKIVFIFLLFSIFKTSAQEFFSGEVYLRDHSKLYLNQIYVTNLTTQKTVLSDYSGHFKILASPNDVLRFTSIITERKDVKLTSEIISRNFNIFELKIAYYEIQEVVVSRFKPSGNLRKDVIALRTNKKVDEIKKMIGLPEAKGDGTSPQLPVAAFRDGGLTFSLESIYDILSGERKKKERLYQYEKMELAITNIQKYFGNQYFIDLKIPENFIPNFLQFVYSSEELGSIVETRNYESTKIYIEKYLPIYLKRLKNSHLMEVSIK